ncbi:MAG: Phosphoribosyl-AMP cyclohydrolase / Phosphoribosyl-ATP pyrophosphatase, partial [uncultured Solirubrobacteraceae bacterium]
APRSPGPSHRVRRARARAVRHPGPGQRRGPHARLHERRGAAPHAGDRGAAPLEPLARRALAQGSHVGQHAGRPRPALRLRRRRAARPGGSGRPGLSHRKAHLLPRRRPRADGARGAARARAHHRRAHRRVRRGLLHRPAAGRPAADRREGARGGRGGHARRPRGERRARGRGGRRRPLPPHGAAALARPHHGRCRGGAAWPSPL